MSVGINTQKNRFNGDGATLIFTYTFRALSTDDIDVYLVDSANVETLQTVGVHYTITLDSDGEGGAVTFITAPTASQDVLIIRSQPLLQPLDLKPEGNFTEDSLEKGYDRVVLQTQDNAEAIDRALKFGIGSEEVDQKVPEPDALKFMRWNAAATALELVAASDILNAVTNDEFWGSSSSHTIDNGAGSTDLTGINTTASEALFKLWLFGYHRHTDSDERLGLGFLMTGVDKSTLIKGNSSTLFPIIGLASGITFAVSTAGQWSYSTDTLAGASYVGLLRIKQVLIKGL